MTHRIISGLLITLALACRGQPQATSSQAKTPQPPAQSTITVSDSLNALFLKLPIVQGSLGERPSDFTGDRTVLQAISSFGDSAVARLVDCLDRTTPTRVTYQGRPIPLGLLCYVVLDYTAYYEAYDERPQHDPNRYAPWPGNVDMSATPEQLRTAKRAWQDVVKRKVYNLT